MLHPQWKLIPRSARIVLNSMAFPRTYIVYMYTSQNCITILSADRVVRSFQFPGCSPVTSEIVQHVFDLCSKYSVVKFGSVVDLPILNADGHKLASPALLVKVFPPTCI